MTQNTEHSTVSPSQDMDMTIIGGYQDANYYGAYHLVPTTFLQAPNWLKIVKDPCFRVTAHKILAHVESNKTK